MILNDQNNRQKEAMFHFSDPVVSIVGMVNSGKSTLFNALIEQRRSIVSPHKGLTRDLIYAPFYYQGRKGYFFDTAGWNEQGDFLEKVAFEKAKAMIPYSDLVLWVIDSLGDYIPEDLLNLLRPIEQKVIVVANKVDHLEQESYAYNLIQLGFTHWISVSAKKKRRLDELKQKIISLIWSDVDLSKESSFNIVARQEKQKKNSDDQNSLSILENESELAKGEKEFSAEDFEKPQAVVESHHSFSSGLESNISIALVGKPNVGKSSLFNALAKKDIALVSHQALTTRDSLEYIIEHKNKPYIFYDTAGMRRRTKVDSLVERYSLLRTIQAIEKAEMVVLVIDHQGLVDQDKKILNVCIHRQKPVIFIANKKDLLPPIQNAQQAFKDKLFFHMPILKYAPVIFTCAQEELPVNSIFHWFDKIHQQLYTKISTHKLNDTLNQWNFQYGLERKGLLKFMVQTSCAPVEFKAFVEHRRFVNSYKDFIANKLRTLGFTNIPLKIYWQQKDK